MGAAVAGSALVFRPSQSPRRRFCLLGQPARRAGPLLARLLI